MQAASRPYALAAALLAATSAVAVTPLASRPFELSIRSIETSLVNVGVENIPVNLFDDMMNVPYNEVQALNTAAGSLFNTGTWWVPGSTNIWGVDPGDTTHVAALDSFIGLPALTGGLGGLNYQIDGLLAAELPVSASCDAATCAPIVPADVITGGGNMDRTIGFLMAAAGQQPFGLFDNWYNVPLSDLINGYTFTQANDPGVIDPSGPASMGFGFPLDGGSNPFEGGTGPGDAMPWDGVTYHLNLMQPLTNFYNSLLAEPATDGIGGTGVQLPTLTELTHGLQNLTAGLIIDFDPYTAGSPACPAACDIPASMQMPALVAAIGNLDPSNTTIQTWLADYAAGTANGPTTSQIDSSVALLQSGMYNMSPEKLAEVDTALGNINPALPALFTNSGVLTDPNYVAYAADPTHVVFDPVYGGYNSTLLPQDVLNYLQDAATKPVDPTLSTDLNTVLTNLTFPGDPSALGGLLGLGAASTSAAAIDPTALSTELSTLLANLGTTTGPDFLSQLATDLAAQFTADLGTIVPSSILSMF